jgi:hypothetical protein
MKKVEQPIGIDGIKRTWPELEELYYDNLLAERGRYVSPLNKLIELKEDASFQNAQEKQLLRYLICGFRRIILAKPTDLERIIEQFERYGFQRLLFNPGTDKLSPVGKKILNAFSYKRLRKGRIAKLGSYINVKSCLYCNAQYTLVINNKNKPLAKFQFDHFFPKNTYPYLSISLYNLIPSCASCNQSKSKTAFELNELIHPFHEDFHVLTQFQINNKAHLELLMGIKVPLNEIQISLTKLDTPKVKNQNNFTSIAGIYKRHSDIVSEIYQKAYAYQNGGKEALMNLEQNGKRIFISTAEIEWMLLANYPLANDINNRPLSKFMQDIAKKAGLIS